MERAGLMWWGIMWHDNGGNDKGGYIGVLSNPTPVWARVG